MKAKSTSLKADLSLITIFGGIAHLDLAGVKGIAAGSDRTGGLTDDHGNTSRSV